MKIGFDATPLAMRGAGVARYTLELLRALRVYAPENELMLLYNRPPADPSIATELEGLDGPEMGTLGYPDFQIHPSGQRMAG